MITRFFKNNKSFNIENITNRRLNKIIQSYSFLYVNNPNDLAFVSQNFNDSDNIFIKQYIEKDQNKNSKLYIIIGFKKTIIIIDKSSFSIFQPFLSAKENLTIYFLTEVNDINFNNKAHSQINVNNDIQFLSEIRILNDQLSLPF